MVVSFALLDVELDFDLGPEAFDSLVLVPSTYLELDATRNLLALGEVLHEAAQRLA